MFVSVRDLKVQFPAEEGLVHAINGLSFTLDRGKTLAIVGESGSGKTATSLAVLGLHGKEARISGEIHVGDAEIVGASAATLRRLRGDRMAMIFQDPLTAMHPYHRVGQQIVEAYRAHRSASRQAGRKRALDMLDRVGITDPNRAFNSYPHQLSGGMRQRVMIAMALVCDPDLLIADEPTTALDVTIQAQILDLLKDLQQEFQSAIILITHDLGVVAEVADDVIVMYAGKAIESGSSRDIFYRPAHPYSWGLLGSMPRVDEHVDRLRTIAGSPPSLVALPTGCAFAPRCGAARHFPDDVCRRVAPPLRKVGASHHAMCHIPDAEHARLRSEIAQPLGEPVS